MSSLGRWSVFLNLFVALVLSAANVPAGDDGAVGMELGGGVTLVLDPVRGLTLILDDGLGRTELCTMQPDRSLGGTSRRQRAHPEIFTKLLHDPVDSGHRGFSSLADDDNDGRTDDDRVDGIDNDGDGLLDEDFAMLGDHMLVMSNRDIRGTHYLRAFHWDYCHLDQTLFLVWDREDRVGYAEQLGLLVESTGLAWTVYEHPADGDADLTHVSRIETDNGPIWLGLKLLDNQSGDRPTSRIRGQRLETSPMENVTCALIVAESLDGLHYRSDIAARARVGGRPNPHEDPIPWLVPPLQQATESTAGPTASVLQTRDGDLEISVGVPQGWCGAPDPARLMIDDRLPGDLKEISWHDAESGDPMTAARAPESTHSTLPDETLSWPPYPGRSQISLGAAEGELRLIYEADKTWQSAGTLNLVTLSGQRFNLEIDQFTTEEMRQSEARDDQAVLSTIEKTSPRLSGGLLEVTPNPFSVSTVLTYRIPRTIAEGFVWDEERPPLLNPDKAIPYSTGTPNVTLNIYSVSGHQVATLFDGSCDIGEYQASWNGVSESGRRLATGTYFCKLQIDKWSTTKSIILVK
jgi:hypothetical protein